MVVEPTDLPKESDELAFLRFFFEAAGRAFGPADHDVYCIIMQDFEDTTKLRVPQEYREDYLYEEEEE